MVATEEMRGKTWAAKGPFSASALASPRCRVPKVPCPRHGQKMWPLATSQPASLPWVAGVNKAWHELSVP